MLEWLREMWKGRSERIEKGNRERIEIERKERETSENLVDNLNKRRNNIITSLCLLFSFPKSLQYSSKTRVPD